MTLSIDQLKPLSVLITALAAACLSLVLNSSQAKAVPCAGGDLDFTATSNLPTTGTTFNVGQQVDLAAVTTGFIATSFAWNIDGPSLKDYQERLGTVISGPISWSTTPLSPADLMLDKVRFYWKPAPSQIHPLNTGPSARNVTLTVTTASGTCSVSKTFQVERNETDHTKQPVDYYTSNHRAATETNPLKGIVIDDHRQWHLDSSTHLYGFLPWHGHFLDRYQRWRAEFGYPPVEPWNPGTPLPTDVAHQHLNRQPSYDPIANLIPYRFTLAGGSGTSGLTSFPTLTSFSNNLESSFHGAVHCNIGPVSSAGPAANFGSMCDFTSPKDPMFWRWHLFIDVLYRNYCALKGLTCAGGPDPATDVWMADNAADLTAGGSEPSPDPRWLSLDIWNRRSDTVCTPTDPIPGMARNCGTSADHENPVIGPGNFLYATLRNDRPGATKLVYAEVAVYIANAATGLSWPVDFNGGVPLPETRRFLTLSLEPGQNVDIGPLPWTAPNPTPSDHFCLYIRVLTVQDGLVTEVPNIDLNVAADNSIAWRNVNVVPTPRVLSQGFSSRFMVRNWRKDEARIDLRVETAEELLGAGEVRLQLGPDLVEAWRKGKGDAKGIEFNGETFLVRSTSAVIGGLAMAPRQEGPAVLHIVAKEPLKPGSALVSVRQLTDGKEDGGVDVALAGEPDKWRELPDLAAAVSGPEKIRAGDHGREAFKILLNNLGGADALGTADAGTRGYRISATLLPGDIKLGGKLLPIAHKGSIGLPVGEVPTPTLRPGESIGLAVPLVLPAKTPPGDYCLLIVVDAGNALSESNEGNNETCLKFAVLN